jgi:hypothetical protein
MNRLEFSCYADFFVRIFKTKEEYGFLLYPPVEVSVTIMEQRLESFIKMRFMNSTSGVEGDEDDRKGNKEEGAK